jgi:peptidoglycan hydrolase CwlO-like protein
MLTLHTLTYAKVEIVKLMNETILLFLSNAITGLAGWFVGRRRQQADTDNQVLRNLELAVGLYKNIIDDLKEEIHQLNIKIQELEKKVDELHKENKKLKSSL